MENDYTNETLEEKRKRLLGILYELRDGYSGEIPEEIIHNEGKYKVRGSWFGTVWLRFDLLFSNHLIPESFIQKRDKIMKDMKLRRSSNRGLTSRIDIKQTDELLTEAINYLELKDLH